MLRAIGIYIRQVLAALVFLLAIVVGLYLYQHNRSELSRIPILLELTDAYAKGWDALGGLSGASVYEFYQSTAISGEEPSPGSLPGGSGKGELLIRTGWAADSVRANLARKGFSARKLQQAQRFLDYVDEYKGQALNDMYRSKVPASIKLAQGILESGAGQSSLAKSTRNHFGIKARPGPAAREKIARREYNRLSDEEFLFTAPAVGAFNAWDDHPYDRFEVYNSVADSYARHSQLLTRPCTPGHTGCYQWIWQAFPVSREEHDISAAARQYHHRTGKAADSFFPGRSKLPYYAACAAGLKMAGYATSPTYHQKLAYLIETYELWRFDMALINAVGEGG